MFIPAFLKIVIDNAENFASVKSNGASVAENRDYLRLMRSSLHAGKASTIITKALPLCNEKITVNFLPIFVENQ
ncbi:MAG TPA: hypothetical protein DDY98_01675 [Ruminococcaceae bacterium]|nr:hypothetical protein [Oscillospiraceae bacterium]